jgi:hypothetical protein
MSTKRGSVVSSEVSSLSSGYLVSVLNWERSTVLVIAWGKSDGSVVLRAMVLEAVVLWYLVVGGIGGGVVVLTVVVVSPIARVGGGRVNGTSGMSEHAKLVVFLCGYLGGV